MILIPELKTVVVFPPRTASGTFKRAILETYSEALPIYRHMEADGVPAGYDRWPKVGVVRDPVERLWSLYKFCADNVRNQQFPSYGDRVLKSVARPFSDWIVNNEVVFTDPHGSEGGFEYYPHYNVRNSIPENRKSQFLTLRPDLGTEVYRFDDLDLFAERLRLKIRRNHNETARLPMPALTSKARDHVERFFSWDLDQTRPFRLRAAE